jgi:hypothetical protein
LLATPGLCKSDNKITITGTIKNIIYLQPYIDEETFLQVVKFPKSGFGTDYDERDRHYYKSNLAKIHFPKNGFFTIYAENLEPGKYFLSGQYFTSSGIYPILMKGKFPATIYVKDNSPQKVDFGEVFIQY